MPALSKDQRDWIRNLINQDFNSFMESSFGPHPCKESGHTYLLEAPLYYDLEPGEEELNDLSKKCAAAKRVSQEYDVGIVIAQGGTPLGYVVKQFGLPVLIVDMKRHTSGVTWKPLDEITEETIKEKRIIVIENDVLTGETLKRAYEELNKLYPKSIDVLLTLANTLVTGRDYEIIQERFRERNISFKPSYRYDHVAEIQVPFVDTRLMVPLGYTNVLTVETDFKPDLNALRDFKLTIIKKYGFDLKAVGIL